MSNDRRESYAGKRSLRRVNPLLYCRARHALDDIQLDAFEPFIAAAGVTAHAIGLQLRQNRALDARRIGARDRPKNDVLGAERALIVAAPPFQVARFAELAVGARDADRSGAPRVLRRSR